MADTRWHKPENISDQRWKQHVDWMQVTGSTTDKHLQEHREGHLWRDYRRPPTEASRF